MANLVSIAITPANPLINAGDTQQFTAIGTYNNNSTQDITASVTWTSSNQAVALVDSAGLAEGLAAGSSMIQAIQDGVSAAVLLTVKRTIVSLTVVPRTYSMQVVATQQFAAIGTTDDGIDLNLSQWVAWDTLDPTIATVDTKGLVTAVAAGSTGVTAAYAPLSNTSVLTVTAVATPGPPVLSPCEQLAKLQGQMQLLMGGQAIVAVDTPQLGRVEFSKGSIGDLQREIDRLSALCAASLGLDVTSTMRRRPLSIEAWP